MDWSALTVVSLLFSQRILYPVMVPSSATSRPVSYTHLDVYKRQHIGRYDRFARFMSDHGYLVCAEDHLGHGNTPENAEDLGYTADKDGWVKMTDNVRALHERIAPQYPGIPYFILGHSMGSFLTRSYLIRYPGTVDACALLGTGQQPESVLKAGLAACRLEQIRLGKRGRSKLLQSLCFRCV